MAPQLVFPRPSSLTWQEQETFLYKQRMVREGKLDNTMEDRWTEHRAARLGRALASSRWWDKVREVRQVRLAP